MKAVIDLLKSVNHGAERGVVIGRGGINLWEHLYGGSCGFMLQTSDFDILCPNVIRARECVSILSSEGFRKIGYTYSSPDLPEIDIVLGDRTLEYGEVVGGFCNFPSLSELWGSRRTVDGLLLVSAESLLLHKMKYPRENEGRDMETIALYLARYPQKTALFTQRAKACADAEERDSMLFSLFAALSEVNPDAAAKISAEIASGINGEPGL